MSVFVRDKVVLSLAGSGVRKVYDCVCFMFYFHGVAHVFGIFSHFLSLSCAIELLARFFLSTVSSQQAILFSMLAICVFGIGRDGLKLIYEKFFGSSKKEKEKNEKKEKKEKKARWRTATPFVFGVDIFGFELLETFSWLN